jgi:hypothetical protein
MYRNFEIKGEKRKTVLNESISTCQKIFKLLLFIDASAVLVFLIYPAFSLLFLNEKHLMLPFYFPLISTNSSVGFILNSIIHGILLLYTLLFHNSFDSIFALYMMQFSTKVKLIKIEFDELQSYVVDTLTQMQKIDTATNKIIGRKLREIAILQQELDLYAHNTSRFFLMPCFITATTSIFSICVALILMLKLKLVMSYGLVYALLGQLFVNFLFGSLVHHQFEILEFHIYDFPWYSLDVSNQKLIKHMLLRSQNPLKFNMAFIGNLTFDTFSNVS